VSHLIVALWGADRSAIVNALAGTGRTISVAVDDQPYRGDPVDVMVTSPGGSIPTLDAFARRVEVWRVEPRYPIAGLSVSGVKMVSFVRRAEGLTHDEFARHWTEQHAPLARRHHIGLCKYTQNVVVEALTPGGADIDGIAELYFRTREDYETRFYDDDAGLAVIREDVKRFIAKPGSETSLMTETA
jgi:uncharacterized protein (TIGR02118 family)